MRSPRYLLLEKLRLVAAVLVVALHTELLSDLLPGGFLIGDGLARLAVPYFAMLTGYFVATRGVDEGFATLRKWGATILRAYVFLFPLYMVFFAWQLSMTSKEPGSTLESVALVALDEIFFRGYAYHLWYLPGIVYAVLITVWLTRVSRGVAMPAALAAVAYVAASLSTTWGWAWLGPHSPTLREAETWQASLAFLTLLFPFVIGGMLIRREQARFTEKAAWLGLALGTVGLIVEASVVRAHDGNPATLLSLPLVGLCGFRLLISRTDRGVTNGFQYGKVSNLIYFYHLFPILVIDHLTRNHPMISVAEFTIAMAIICLMVAVTLRTRLSRAFA